MIFGCYRSFSRVFNLKMASVSRVKLLPNTVQGMKQLDRDKFLHKVKLLGLKLPINKVSQTISVCKPYILKLENLRPVVKLSEEHKPFDRWLYLNPEIITCWKDIPEDIRRTLTKHDISEDNLDITEIQLKYENFKFDDIFKAVLPVGEETVSGFSQIGHIVHLNLRGHLLEYKTLIGNVLVDKVKNCRTVVNKSDIIDNTFRYFNMEVLAGDVDFLVTVKESQCTFQFDFSRVYWNPRLCTEHERVISCIKHSDVLFDVFCGVGPFAIPAVKKLCRVFANDINPESFRWLNHNADCNSIRKNLLKTYNMDAADFICTIFKHFIKSCCKGQEILHPCSKIHVTMNLPASAVEFLKYFNGLIEDKNLIGKFDLNIFVYIYCFTVGDDHVQTSKQMVIDNIGRDVSSDILDILFVRNVAPKKEMMKVSLKLTKEVLFGIDSDNNSSEPPLKKKCVESVEN